MNQNTDQKKIDILLVEDNPFEAKLAIRALTKHKLANALFHVEDGEEALNFIFARESYAHRKSEPFPKIILLDLKLPKVSGLEVLKELKDNELTRGIPVIILTSSNQERDIKVGYNYGVNSYIVKPVEFDEFSKAVAELGMYWMFLNQSGAAG
ncbi:MAG: two-component system response regulator [Bacteroidota bacterium]|nr:two-component system response regulator [Bacteroidota bacterium]